MNRKKRGSLQLSVSAIVVLILALTMLSIGLVFVKGMLGKMFLKFDEQISEEPEPPNPSLSHPVTLSRNPVISQKDTIEVIKVSVLNPAYSEISKRNYVKKEGICGEVDGICFIDVDDTTGMCNTVESAKRNDPDCNTGFLTGMDCEQNSDKSPCLISNVYADGEAGGGIMYCPYEPGEPRDPNCEPSEGIEIYISCDTRLMEKPFKRNIGKINGGASKTNIVLLKLRSTVADDHYLCKVNVFAEDKDYLEDLVVKIENE